MINIVVYTEDFEPINVISIPIDTLNAGHRLGLITLQVASNGDIINTCVLNRTLMVGKDGIQVFWTTKHEEVALNICPDWLPGQLAVFNSYKNGANKLAAEIRKLKK